MARIRFSRKNSDGNELAQCKLCLVRFEMTNATFSLPVTDSRLLWGSAATALLPHSYRGCLGGLSLGLGLIRFHSGSGRPSSWPAIWHVLLHAGLGSWRTATLARLARLGLARLLGSGGRSRSWRTAALAWLAGFGLACLLGSGCGSRSWRATASSLGGRVFSPLILVGYFFVLVGKGAALTLGWGVGRGRFVPIRGLFSLDVLFVLHPLRWSPGAVFALWLFLLDLQFTLLLNHVVAWARDHHCGIGWLGRLSNDVSALRGHAYLAVGLLLGDFATRLGAAPLPGDCSSSASMPMMLSGHARRSYE